VGDLAWALRAGEISALEFGDMVIKRTGVLIAVRRSKTYQDDHGQLVSVAAANAPGSARSASSTPRTQSAEQARPGTC